MSVSIEQRNRSMLRARTRIDRDYAERMDIPALARAAGCSEAHFIRIAGVHASSGLTREWSRRRPGNPEAARLG
jgi:AraC-like DNA-binding protein